MQDEVWKAVPDAPGYEVSNRGRVRSYHLIGRHRIGSALHLKAKAHLLRLELRPASLCVSLRDAAGKVRQRYVHRLVLEAFVGPCPAGCEGCHNDGNFRNNALENLRWDTRAANMADIARHGRLRFGERHWFAKIKDKDARMIRKLLSAGYSGNRIAKLFGVCSGTIARVKQGRYRMQRVQIQ